MSKTKTILSRGMIDLLRSLQKPSILQDMINNSDTDYVKLVRDLNALLRTGLITENKTPKEGFQLTEDAKLLLFYMENKPRPLADLR